jgi:hypothetical protein
MKRIIISIIAFIILVTIFFAGLIMYPPYSPTLPYNNSYTTTKTLPIPANATGFPHGEFYFLNQTDSDYYYVFVINYSDYIQMVNVTENGSVFLAMFNFDHSIIITKNIINGNQVLLIGRTTQLPIEVGQSYLIDLVGNKESQIFSFTYEGNWNSVLP